MGDMSSMSRENKKQQLRRRVISSGMDARQAARYVDDSEEVVRRAHRKAVGRRIFLLAATAAAAAVIFLGWQYYKKNYRFSSFESVWELPINEGSLVGYQLFGSNVLKYTKDGASYIDDRGKNIWTESYEMKSPIIAVNGSYAAIGDQQGNTIYICNEEGCQGMATTVLPISKIAVSGTGIVTAVLEDSTASYITFFKKDGSDLDIAIKTKMAGDGYPLDMALSEDGTQLMCSYVFLQNGELRNRVVFYDFSEVGKNVPNRLVGGFDDPFAGTMVPRVAYLKPPCSCAFTGNGPVFFSSKNLASPQMIAQADLTEDEIKAVFYSMDYVGVIVRNTGGTEQSRMEIYKADGTHVMSREFTYDYTDAGIVDDWVILHNDHSCRIFNMSGIEKIYAEFDFTISCVCKGRFPNTLVVTGPQMMKEIRLK